MCFSLKKDNMKYRLLLFAVLLVNFLCAQSKNIYIQYSVKILDEKILRDVDIEFRSLFVEAMSSANSMSFGLIINESGSKFYQLPILLPSDDSNSIRTAGTFAGYSGEVFQFRENTYSESSTYGKNILIKESLKTGWQLYDETKMIDNYLCYKATNINRIDNGSKKIFNHPVTAWFCPELPYSYGPNGYSNLPGLILQLQVRNVVFAAKRIELNSDLDFDSSFLETVRTMSLEDLNKKIDEEMQILKNSIRD
jgi:GLPGLI family protein